MEFLDKAIDVLQNSVMLQAGLVATIMQFLFSLIKTETPKGWFYIASDVCKKLATIFDVLAKFLDKILPQRLKDESK